MSKYIFFLIFMSSLFGATFNQIFYLVGLKYTTTTIAVALYNLSPAITFLLAVVFRQENMAYKERYGQAKILGTIICVGGAMLLCTYNGTQIIPNANITIDFIDSLKNIGSMNTHKKTIAGVLLVTGSTISGVIWFIIQAKLAEKYPAPLSTSAWINLLASIECTIVALAIDHRKSAWSLASPIRVVSPIYAGLVCSSLAFYLMAWAIQIKGAVYVSIFSPVQLILVALLGWIVLDEVIFVGTLAGSVLIVAGLYVVLWGMKKEQSVLMPQVSAV